MASNFVYNTRDIKFILKEWLPTEEIFAYPKYDGYYSKDDIDMFIDQFYKIAAEVIFPPTRMERTTRCDLRMAR